MLLYMDQTNSVSEHAVSNFDGTKIKIWAGFGLVGITEKKNWADYEQLLRAFFSCFHWQIFLFFLNS